MAGAQKKTTPAKKRGGTKKKPVQQRPIRREVGGLVCWLLALCVLVSYFRIDAIVVTYLSVTLKGLTGYGYYLWAASLVFAGTVLIFHHGRPVRLRLSCILAMPWLLGALCHQLLCKIQFVDSVGILKKLWHLGGTLEGGGVLSGTMAVALEALFSPVVSIIILTVLLVVTLMVACRLTVGAVVEKIKSHQRLEYEPEPEVRPAPKPPAIPKSNGKKAIDIPLDEERVTTEGPLTTKKGGLSGLFRHKDAHIRTPDELLIEESAAKSPPQPVSVPQPAAPTPAPVPLTPAPTPLAAEPGAKSVAKPIDSSEVAAAAEEVSQEIESQLETMADHYAYPPLDLLEKGGIGGTDEAGAELRNNSRRLSETLQSFGVDAAAGDVVRGPSVTRYEFVLDQGVKLSKITNLADDIALALGSSGVRIAPIPDKISAVGIEVPNKKVSMVRIRDVIESSAFTTHSSAVAFAVGKDIGGSNIVGNLAKLPHVLIAGTTGSGKSVCTNSLVISMLYKSTPEDVRFIMVDPKMVELAPYNGIPHLLIPVVTDPKKAAGALQWAVFEMMKRYKTFSECNVKDLESYNALAAVDPEVKKLPTVVVVIDELADLMLVAAKEVEESICRVAQMGRAAGMHLVIATQRPSADVITGIMKANIPSRIAFAVASSLESRIILDQTGAEKLVGRGDMLYAPLGAGKPTRVQGCLISGEEIERVVSFVKETGSVEYSQEVMQKIEESMQEKEKTAKGASAAAAADSGEEEGDELLPAAVEVLLETGQASVSMLQRRLKLGYSRAARLVDQMEERGYVGPFEGSKPRQLLITRAQWEQMKGSTSVEPLFEQLSNEER